MLYVVYNTLTVRIVGIYATQAAAAAAVNAGTDLASVAATVAAVGLAEPGWYWNVTDSEPQREPIQGAADTAVVRREILRANIRGLEGVEGLAAWAANDDGGRAKSYSRWVEMQARAAMSDPNLADDTRYAAILFESVIPGRVWYWLHFYTDPQGVGGTGNSWGQYLGDDRSTWLFWATTGASVTPNSRGATRVPGMTFNVTDDWVAWLGS